MPTNIIQIQQFKTQKILDIATSKLWKMNEFYEINFDPWTNYQVFDSNGCFLVEISRPEAVTLTLPNDRKIW